MIDPTEADVGRAVVYRAQYRGDKDEAGVITSFNDSYVFVRYGSYQTPRATRRGDLEWNEHGGPEDSPDDPKAT